MSCVACANVTFCRSPRGYSGTQWYTKLTMQTRTMVGIHSLRWRAVAMTALAADGTIQTCNDIACLHPIPSLDTVQHGYTTAMAIDSCTSAQRFVVVDFGDACLLSNRSTATKRQDSSPWPSS